MSKKLFIFILALLIFCTSCLVSCKPQSNFGDHKNPDSSNQDTFPETISSLLLQLSAAEWANATVKQNLGECELFFNGYDVYDEYGISIGYGENYSDGGLVSLTGNAKNILLHAPYTEEIFRGVSLADTAESVKNTLGEPAYILDSENVFGYKADGFYIFFVGAPIIEEISIWPIFEVEGVEGFEEDSVFTKEISRLQMNKNILSLAENGKKSPDGTKSIVPYTDVIPELAGFHVIDLSGEGEDFSVLTPNFYCTGIWINDRYFLYTFTKMFKLRIYDMEERKIGNFGAYDIVDVIEVFEDENRIECISYQDEDFTFAYQINEDGEISLFKDGKDLCKITWE